MLPCSESYRISDVRVFTFIIIIIIIRCIILKEFLIQFLCINN